MKLKVNDIVENGIGIAIIREIEGEVATLSYMERDLPITHKWTANIGDLTFICHSKTLKDIPIPTEFLKQIEDRNIELKNLQIKNAERMAEKASRRGIKKKKSEEEILMEKLLSKLSPSQILELTGG